MQCEDELSAVQQSATGTPSLTGPGPLDDDTELEIQPARGGGRRLPESVHSFFKPRFDRDLGNVRIHTDETGGRAARGVHAPAFTVGTDMVFTAGAYQPSTRSGRHLLAHELNHVVQQGGGSESIQRRKEPADYGFGSQHRGHLHPPAT